MSKRKKNSGKKSKSPGVRNALANLLPIAGTVAGGLLAGPGGAALGGSVGTALAEGFCPQCAGMVNHNGCSDPTHAKSNSNH